MTSASLRVIVTRRRNYASKACDDAVPAVASARVIGNGIATEAPAAYWSLPRSQRRRRLRPLGYSRGSRNLLSFSRALPALWEHDLPKPAGKSDAAEAIRYALGRREALERFPRTGTLCSTPKLFSAPSGHRTTTGERSLIAAGDGGGRSSAIIAAGHAKMNQAERTPGPPRPLTA